MSEKKYGVYLLLGAGILLSLFLIFGTGSGKKEAPAVIDPGREEVEGYRADTEGRIRSLLEAMNGVEGVKVMVSLECGYEREYTSLASSLPLVRVRTPVIRGIAVVCRGGDNAVIQQRITSLLCALYHLDATRVQVSG